MYTTREQREKVLKTGKVPLNCKGIKLKGCNFYSLHRTMQRVSMSCIGSQSTNRFTSVAPDFFHMYIPGYVAHRGLIPSPFSKTVSKYWRLGL